MLTDDKFRDSAMKFCLLKDTADKYFTLDEYKTLIEAAQTDKDGNLVYLYATNVTEQYTYIQAANDKGYSVLVLDGQLDSHFVGMLEQKLEKSRFVRVDSDVIDNLIPKADKKSADLTSEKRDMLTTLFSSQIPAVEKSQFFVTFEAMGENSMPIVITQNEYMRRMKEMASLQPGMSFYGDMPDSFNLTVNVEHPVVAKIMASADENLDAKVAPLAAEISATNAKIEAVNKEVKDNKPTVEQEKQLQDLMAEVDAKRKSQNEIISGYSASQPVVRQLIDLALLGNGLLKGADLSAFISRSVKLL
jgi:molecular chaperone HtpG